MVRAKPPEAYQSKNRIFRRRLPSRLDIVAGTRNAMVRHSTRGVSRTVRMDNRESWTTHLIPIRSVRTWPSSLDSTYHKPGPARKRLAPAVPQVQEVNPIPPQLTYGVHPVPGAGLRVISTRRHNPN